MATLISGCSTDSGSVPESNVGAIGLSLQLAPGETLDAVTYTITGPGGFARVGTLDTSHSTTVAGTIGSLPAGSGFAITLDGTSTDGGTHCVGSASFDIVAHATTTVSVHLRCNESPHTGSVTVNGTLNVCPTLDGISASPAEVNVGASLSLTASAHDSDAGPSALAYHWTATGGTLSATDAASASLRCTATGVVTVSVTATDGDCSDSFSTMVRCTTGSGGSFGAMDLSRYVRVARHALPEPSRTTPPNPQSLLAQEASAVTYDWDTDTLFVVGDGGTSVVQVSKTGALLDSMSLAAGTSPQGTEFYDTEGVAYVGGGKFVLTEERYRQVNLFTYVAGATLQRADVQTVKLGTTIGNVGIEGVTFDPANGHFIFVKETGPRSIFETAIDFPAGTATNGSPTTEESTDLFDPSLVSTLDFSDVFALSNLPSLSGDPSSAELLIISQESGRIVQVDRAGSVKHTLTIVADPSDAIAVPDMTMEGITMDRDGTLYVVNENGGGNSTHPELWVYAPSTAANVAPSAVALSGAVTSLPDNTNTTAALKLADIVVTDDGLGDNGLSLSGTDAAAFEIVGSALFLKAGTTLNAATQASYQVTVNVDDTTVGATPDRSTSYTLAITLATGGTVSVAITEVAAWSSGNSSLASDWFELTNLGTSAVSLTGWTMDDNSNSFAVSVPLNGVASLDPGESAIFIETSSSSELAAKAQAFQTLWFGGPPPGGIKIGTYSGSGVGLSTGGDAVNVFDGGGTVRAAISFGASPSTTVLPTFDNSAGLNNVAISSLSVAGQNGAFAAANDGNEIGSPGTTGFSGTPIVGITAVDASASETSSEPGVLRFTRTGSTASALTVVYAIAAGTGKATADDYTPALSGSQLMPAGVAFVDVTVAPVDDAVVEGVEELTLTLSDTGSYDVGASASATVTIQDNDSAPPPPPAPSVVISEVAPWSSGNSVAALAADWFEVTNTGSATVDITGWKVDDSSHAFATALALNGITAIAPGESVIFIETANLATASAAFRSLWFGSNPQRVPQIGSYTGSGIGLSTSGDEVVLFDAAGNIVTGVAFGASPAAAPFGTFDNHAGAGSNAVPFPLLATLSTVGVNGAFAAPGDANELGSPGIGNVARLLVTEVAPWASGGTPYTADWFEVTNVGSAAVDLTGWKMDDSSNDSALSVALLGVASLGPGQSAVFLEGTSTNATNLVTAWFGSSPPAGFLLGTYSGSGVGLSTSGDAVNLFDPQGKRITGVTFGAATPNVTFDNVAGLAAVTTLSSVGVNGAILAADGAETGSPGTTR